MAVFVHDRIQSKEERFENYEKVVSAIGTCAGAFSDAAGRQGGYARRGISGGADSD